MSGNINLILKALKGFSIIAQERLDDYVDVSDDESRKAAEQILQTITYESKVMLKGLKEKLSDILLDEMHFATEYDIEELAKRVQNLENKIDELNKKIK